MRARLRRSHVLRERRRAWRVRLARERPNEPERPPASLMPRVPGRAKSEHGCQPGVGGRTGGLYAATMDGGNDRDGGGNRRNGGIGPKQACRSFVAAAVLAPLR